MEPPTKQSSNHHIILQVGIRITLTTPTFTAVNTHVVSMAAATNQPNFILEDCIDGEEEVPNTMAPILEMTTHVLSTIRHQIKMRADDIMQQLSKQLGDIVKPMVMNEIKKAREDECNHGQLEAMTNFVLRI